MRYPLGTWIGAIIVLALRMGAFTLLSFPGVENLVAHWALRALIVGALIYGILNYRGN